MFSHRVTADFRQFQHVSGDGGLGGGGCLSEALHGWVEIGDKRLEN